MAHRNIVVTGGAGFIGSNFIRNTLDNRRDWRIINLDSLTYAGNPGNLEDVETRFPGRYRFVKGDIADPDVLNQIFTDEDITGIFHFAAESHVDRSIDKPSLFIETNVMGTYKLLETAFEYWVKRNRPSDFRFLHVSTDEVYGSLGIHGYFTENTPYDPSSPYSASKASSDHFVRAWFRTYGLPTLITNCSNNYGPFQFPEKLIPLMILNIMAEKPLPVYGDGKNVRDWLFVTDHCDALLKVFDEGRPGDTYNIGGNAEKRNIDIVRLLCEIMDARLGRTGKNSSTHLIEYVTDRPGHDRRYAIDASKIRNELNWSPQFNFDDAIEKTVDWYLANQAWVDSVRSGDYQVWIDKHYQQ